MIGNNEISLDPRIRRHIEPQIRMLLPLAHENFPKENSYLIADRVQAKINLQFPPGWPLQEQEKVRKAVYLFILEECKAYELYQSMKKDVNHTWDNLPTLAVSPVKEPFSYREFVRYILVTSPEKELINIVPFGWETSKIQAIYETKLLYEFVDDPKLVLMSISLNVNNKIQLIIRASFMRDSVVHIEASTFNDLTSKLSDFAKKRGLNIKIVN